MSIKWFQVHKIMNGCVNQTGCKLEYPVSSYHVPTITQLFHDRCWNCFPMDVESKTWLPKKKMCSQSRDIAHWKVSKFVDWSRMRPQTWSVNSQPKVNINLNSSCFWMELQIFDRFCLRSTRIDIKSFHERSAQNWTLRQLLRFTEQVRVFSCFKALRERKYSRVHG